MCWFFILTAHGEKIISISAFLQRTSIFYRCFQFSPVWDLSQFLWMSCILSYPRFYVAKWAIKQTWLLQLKRKNRCVRVRSSLPSVVITSNLGSAQNDDIYLSMQLFNSIISNKNVRYEKYFFLKWAAFSWITNLVWGCYLLYFMEIISPIQSEFLFDTSQLNYKLWISLQKPELFVSTSGAKCTDPIF